MLSEQVYWVFTVTVDQMDKFMPLIPKLVAATEKEPGALDPAILSNKHECPDQVRHDEAVC